MKILLTADWHIRGDTPICRVEKNWLEVQQNDIRAVHHVYEEEHCDEMWILGDLFHRAICSTETVNMLLAGLSLWKTEEVKILPGNHDLPYHSYENIECSSLGVVLKKYQQLNTGNYGNCRLYARPFGLDDPIQDANTIEQLGINAWATHRLTFPTPESRPIEDCGYLAQELLDIAPKIQLILTGDYHHGYIYREGDRKVVTPGCLNIQAADMKEYSPRVYILETDDMTVYERMLPNNAQVTDQHLLKEKERDERLERCVARIGESGNITLDFEENLEEALRASREGVITIQQEIKSSLYGEKHETCD